MPVNKELVACSTRAQAWYAAGAQRSLHTARPGERQRACTFNTLYNTVLEADVDVAQSQTSYAVKGDIITLSTWPARS